MASMAGPINVWIDLHYLLVPPVCKTPASIVLWVLVWPRNWTPNFCAFSNILVQLSSTALALTIRHGVGKSWIFLPTWLGYGILRNEFFLDNWTQLLNCLVILHIWKIFYTEIFLDTSIWIFTPKISTNYKKCIFVCMTNFQVFEFSSQNWHRNKANFNADFWRENSNICKDRNDRLKLKFGISKYVC